MSALPPEMVEITEQLAIEGDPEALPGGITNQNFKARLAGRDVVLRVCGKNTDQLGIDRDAERLATETAFALAIGPEVVAYVDECSCLVTAFVDGSVVSEDDLRGPDVLVPVGRALRRFHDSGTQLPTRFDVPALAREYAHRSGGEGRAEVHDAIAVADRIAALVGDETVPCHNDLLAANFIRTSDSVVILDWEYAAIGSRYFDLGNLSINNGFSAEDDRRLLAAYGMNGEGDFARLRLMRAMSDIREAMWGVIQAVISTIEFDFDTYSREHFERLHQTLGEPDIEEWITSGTTP